VKTLPILCGPGRSRWHRYSGPVAEPLWSPYEQIAAFFREHAADSAYNAHYDRPAVLAALGPVSGLRVLDAACGPGLYLRELLNRGAQVTAFDASPAMVALARDEAAGQADVTRAVLGEPLPYPDDTFDRAICTLAIHHAPDRHAVCAELHRVLRPGGLLVISTSHPFTDWLHRGGSYFDTSLVTDNWPTPAGQQPVSYWTEPLSAVCAAATTAGFLIAELIEPLPAPSMRARYPEEYRKLSEQPFFLVLRLLKPPQPGQAPQC
jgi:SAM-dependent methyltransferase